MKSDKKINDRLLEEACRIGDRLSAEAETGAHGIYWRTMHKNEDQDIVFVKSESIYTGVSGIVLFFLELYKQTGNNRYMEAAKAGINWVNDYCGEKKNSQNYAFFTGRMGVSYTLLKMYAATKESEYLKKALEIAGNCTDFLKVFAVDDLINGTSGTLLGLLHLHAASGEKWILERIDLFIKHLVERAHFGPRGLYWDRSPRSISGLCGFSHGAAGIGFVFLELGHYFQNDSFFKIAEQAFLYESCFYDESRKNWLDLRKDMYNDEIRKTHKKAFLEGNLDFFIKGKEMNAWCHGAAGIGLSRLRACQLLRKNVHKYNVEARAAIDKTILTDVDNIPPPLFILCHGSGGNAELFLYAYQTFKDKKYLSLAEKVAERALSFYDKHNHYLSGFSHLAAGTKEDRSLFMGNAGIGYFYLRLLAPLHVPSILAPALHCAINPESSNLSPSRYPFIGISPAGLQKHLLQKDFKRTLFFLGDIAPQKLNTFFNHSRFNARISLMRSFITFIKKTIPILPSPEKERFSDIFALESKKRHMDETIESHALLNIKEEVLTQQAKEIVLKENEAFLNVILRLEPDIRIIITGWNWNLSRPEEWVENINRDPDTIAVLLKPTPLGIMETGLSPLSYTVFKEFYKLERRVEDVIRVVTDGFGSLNSGDKEVLKEKIIQQVKQGMLAGILVPVKKKPPY